MFLAAVFLSEVFAFFFLISTQSLIYSTSGSTSIRFIWLSWLIFASILVCIGKFSYNSYGLIWTMNPRTRDTLVIGEKIIIIISQLML